MRRFAIAAAVTIAGCGGGGGGASDADRDEAQKVLTAYGRAYAAGDGDAGCRRLTKRMRDRYERRGEPCAVAFRRSAAADRPNLEFARASISGEQDDGLRGFVEFSERGGPGMGGEVHLVKRGGEWLLDRDLLCITPACEP